MKESIRILKDEHRSISAVLLGLEHLAQLAQDTSLKPDFQVFRSMLRYIDEYPERLHQPKEDEALFALLARRAPEARPLVEELQAEHRRGAQLIRELERKLMFFEERWPRGAAEFLGVVHAYADFHWQHMCKEEAQLLPLAERHFTPADWLAVDAAFARNRDPIADIEEGNFRKLFSRIAMLAPAPVGARRPVEEGGELTASRLGRYRRSTAGPRKPRACSGCSCGSGCRCFPETPHPSPEAKNDLDDIQGA